MPQVNEWIKCPMYQIPGCVCGGGSGGGRGVLDPHLGIDA